ncbi:MAG: hypothetical protein JWM21_1570 [Acidobacteria bacterium]|nr:hypothetical protein [Acidobacteriota bacterium]
MTSTILASLLLLCSLGQQPELADFARDKLQGDDSVRVEDAYKWLHQATRGNAHAITDEKTVREELQREWGSLGQPLPDEKLWEPLRQDEKVGRFNLRPFRARGGKLEDLLAAFLQSAKDFPGDQTGKGFMVDDEAAFHIAWNTLGMSLDRKPVGNLNWPEWRRLDEETDPKKYPAIHHSVTYEKKHQPAYRLLTHDEAEKLIKSLKQQAVKVAPS